MSFYTSLLGRPESLKTKLREYSNNLTPPSKDEFDAVLPAIETIIDQNVGNVALRVTATGHAQFADGKKVQGNCNVTVENLGFLVD